MRCNHIVIQLSPPKKIIIFVLLFFLSLAQSFVTAISSPELASCLAGDGSPGSSVSQTSWYLDLLFWTFPLLTPLFVLFYWLNLSSSPPSPLAPLAFSALCSLLSHHQSVPWSAPLSRERSPGQSPHLAALLLFTIMDSPPAAKLTCLDATRFLHFIQNKDGGIFWIE